MKYYIGSRILKTIQDFQFLKPALLPNVETHIFYGKGIDTPKSFDFLKDSDFPDYPQINYGDGDGSVNLESLEWLNNNSFESYAYTGVDHSAILSNSDVLKKISFIANDAINKKIDHD